MKRFVVQMARTPISLAASLVPAEVALERTRHRLVVIAAATVHRAVHHGATITSARSKLIVVQVAVRLQ